MSSTASNIENTKTGMTDTELELACKAQFTGYATWVYWTSELYGLGKCFRIWTKYPGILPLFIHADHGVVLYSNLLPLDIKSRAKVFFTWNPMKEQRSKDFPGKKVIRIMHPWIPYRRLRGIKRSKTPSGTLVFFTHSTPATRYEGHDTDDYFKKLRELPDKFQPVVLCLHMHDVTAGLHKKLRRHGFPIVTAGYIMSVNFVDHFYDLVKNYSYATSQGWGSNVAYCVEFGIPYFFLGERPELVNISDKNLRPGVAPQYFDKYDEDYNKKAESLFRLPVDNVTDEQRTFVESLLGMDSKITRKQVSQILWHEFFCNWWKLHLILRSVLLSFLGKLGLVPKVKRFLQYFK